MGYDDKVVDFGTSLPVRSRQMPYNVMAELDRLPSARRPQPDYSASEQEKKVRQKLWAAAKLSQAELDALGMKSLDSLLSPRELEDLQGRVDVFGLSIDVPDK